MLLDFNNKNLSNEKTTDFSDIINSFIKTLSNYLENLINKNDVTYAVSSISKDGTTALVITRDGSGEAERYNLNELPDGTTAGTILQKENGKFVINEELTEKRMQELDDLEKYYNELHSQFKTEGVDYLVVQIADDYVALQNQVTGLQFDVSDLNIELLYSIKEGDLLTCENGEYVIKMIEFNDVVLDGN